MSLTHYPKLKSICDWLLHIDSNGDYDSIYDNWAYFTPYEQLTEVCGLISIVKEYLAQEQNAAYIASFTSALGTLEKIKKDLEDAI
jgi:hypothetical protein